MIHRRSPAGTARTVFLVVAGAALIAAFGQVTLGGVVRVTGSGLGCPDWPLCHGGIIPPFELAALIEYSHRLSASLIGVLALATAAMSWMYYRAVPWIMWPSALGLAMVVAAAILGGATVLTELAWWVVLFHLGIAETAVACFGLVLVAAWAQTGTRDRTRARTKPDCFNVLVSLTALGAFLLILSGAYMVGYGAGSSCDTWPLCRGSLLPESAPPAVHMVHRFFAAAVGSLVAVSAASAWSRRRRRPDLAWAGLVLALLFIAQVIVGAATVWSGFSSEMRAVHLSVATLMWMALVMLAALGLTARQAQLRGVVANAAPVSGPDTVAT